MLALAVLCMASVMVFTVARRDDRGQAAAWDDGGELPPIPPTYEALAAYTRDVAGQVWFRKYFTRIAFDESGALKDSLCRWEESSVRIDVLNDGGRGMGRYVQSVVDDLNRLQLSTRFAIVDGPADITVKYLPHGEYVRVESPDGSVGVCWTQTLSYALPAMEAATIYVDAGKMTTRGQRQTVVIHELTHAIGFLGHLRRPSSAKDSVLYYASSLRYWSPADEACIYLMYSPAFRSGMTRRDVRSALRDFAAAAGP